MIPVATILTVVGKVTKGAMEWLNSAAGNMFKGWVKGRKDQQRIDTIAQQKREGSEVTRIHERLQEQGNEELKERFQGDRRDPADSPHIRVRGTRPRWKP